MDLEINLFLRACIALLSVIHSILDWIKPKPVYIWNQLSMYIHIHRDSNCLMVELGLKRNTTSLM